MKRSAFFLSLILTASLHAEDDASLLAAKLEATAARQSATYHAKAAIPQQDR